MQLKPCKFEEVCALKKVYEGIAYFKKEEFKRPPCDECSIYQEKEDQNERNKKV